MLEVVKIQDAPILEQFLWQTVIDTFVIYTYYDANEKPLYVGASKGFYDRRYLDMYRFGDVENEKIKYTGLVFYDTEEAMKEAKKHWIAYKRPLWNKRKYENFSFFDDVIGEDELVVNDDKLLKYWSWHLGDEVEVEEWED